MKKGKEIHQCVKLKTQIILNFYSYLFAVCTINKNWYAIGDILEKTQESILDCDDNFPCAHQQIKNFIYKVKMSLTKKMIAIPVGSIVRICVHIVVKYSPIDYIILQPNKNMNTIDHCIYSLYVHVDYRAKRAFLVCYMILLYIPFLLFIP